jgi:hypothetical protein
MTNLEAKLSNWESIYSQLGQARGLLEEAHKNGDNPGVIAVLTADIEDLDRATALALNELQEARMANRPT